MMVAGCAKDGLHGLTGAEVSGESSDGSLSASRRHKNRRARESMQRGLENSQQTVRELRLRVADLEQQNAILISTLNLLQGNAPTGFDSSSVAPSTRATEFYEMTSDVGTVIPDDVTVVDVDDIPSHADFATFALFSTSRQFGRVESAIALDSHEPSLSRMDGSCNAPSISQNSPASKFKQDEKVTISIDAALRGTHDSTFLSAEHFEAIGVGDCLSDESVHTAPCDSPRLNCCDEEQTTAPPAGVAADLGHLEKKTVTLPDTDAQFGLNCSGEDLAPSGEPPPSQSWADLSADLSDTPAERLDSTSELMSEPELDPANPSLPALDPENSSKPALDPANKEELALDPENKSRRSIDMATEKGEDTSNKKRYVVKTEAKPKRALTLDSAQDCVDGATVQASQESDYWFDKVRGMDVDYINKIDKKIHGVLKETHHLLGSLSWSQFSDLPSDAANLWAQDLYVYDSYVQLNGLAQQALCYDIENGSFDVVFRHLRKQRAVANKQQAGWHGTWQKAKWRS